MKKEETMLLNKHQKNLFLEFTIKRKHLKNVEMTFTFVTSENNVYVCTYILAIRFFETFSKEGFFY